MRDNDSTFAPKLPDRPLLVIAESETKILAVEARYEIRCCSDGKRMAVCADGPTAIRTYLLFRQTRGCPACEIVDLSTGRLCVTEGGGRFLMSGELLPIQRDLTPEEFFGLALRRPAAIARVVDPRVVDVKVVENKRVDPLEKQIEELQHSVWRIKFSLESDGIASAHMIAVGAAAQLNLVIKELSKRAKAGRR